MGHLRADCDAGGGVDHLSKLIARAAFVLALSVFAVSAWAQTCIIYRVSANGQVGEGPTPAGACSAAAFKLGVSLSGSDATASFNASFSGAINASGGCVISGTTTRCPINGSCTTSPYSATFAVSSASINCTCEAKTGTPGAIPGMAIMQYSGGNGTSPAMSNSGCNDGCQVDMSKAIQGATRSPGGEWWVQVDVSQTTHTGNSCTPSAASPDTANRPTRPAGTCPGTVNGNPVDVPCTESGAKDTKVEVKTNPNGSTSVTTTTTNTTCNGAGACTTTTIVNGPGGTTTTTTTDTKAGHCASNPGSNVCGDGTGGNGNGDGEGDGEDDEDPSTFGGACGSFSCTGDAIQCAMAREQHQRNCELLVNTSSLSDIGNAATTGTDPSDHPKNQAEQIAVDLAAAISSVPMFGGSGGCPSDVSMSVQGHSFSFPFSSLCPYLQLLGAAFLAACYLSAAFIVFKRD